MASPMATSQPASPMPDQDPNMPRLMQIKVLYTFDDEKSTCLARCPYPVDVHTLVLDDNTQIGIVELRTCIQAIVAASPELVAKLGQDYTIYAYDYSEYETPLVGQGMLSWALASASATPTAPADQSRTPVTGRVVKNARALFPNSGPSEVLQVKLKLVPVPTCRQSEYLASMQKYRDASSFASQGFDPAAWTAFLRSNSNLDALGPHQPSFPQDQGNHAVAFHTSGQPHMPIPQRQQPEQFVFHQNENANHVEVSSGRKASSRPATPKSRKPAAQSRPSSRGSTRGRPPLKHAASCASRVESVHSQIPSELDNTQSRKRARIQQTDWQGPSAFENREDSLRVSASVAASVRGHKSSGGHPTAADIAAAEPGIRPPTPRPSARLTRTDTAVAHETMTQKPRWYQSPYTMDGNQGDGAGSTAASPEEHNGSIASTPLDIPSSPPIVRHGSPTPSSPALPRLVNHPDSGFVSGQLDSCFDDDDEMRPLDDDDIRNASHYSSRQFGLTSELSIMEEIPGDPSLLPQRNVQTQRPRAGSRSTASKRRGNSVAASSPRLPPLIPSRTNEDIPQQALYHGDTPARTETDRPGLPCPSNTHPISQANLDNTMRAEVSMPTDGQERAESTEVGADGTSSQGGSGMKRKKAIQNRMQQDIAAGKMPPYCHNCGEIDTPTWRKCFVKTEKGSPAHLQLSDSEDGLLAWEALEKGDNSTITSYRMIKKSLTPADAGFEELRLCNSCGIWLFKIKSMRPENKWTKQPAKQPARKRPSRTKSAKNAKRLASGSLDPDEAALASALMSDNGQSSNEYALTDVSGRSDKSQPKSSGTRKRAASASFQVQRQNNASYMSDAAAAAALHRAIQSSPPKFPGSKTAPIDLDGEENAEDAGPVRRLLFPSPRKSGEMKTLGIEGSTKQTAETAAMPDPFASLEQENSSASTNPTCEQHETPTSQDPDNQPRYMLRTPTRSSASKGLTPRGLFSSGKRARSNPETPTRAALRDTINQGEMTPFTAQLNQLISEGNADPNFNLFGEAPQDTNGLFAFTDFGAGDDFGSDMPIPPSDGDFFPVYEDADMEMWNGGPLLEGELDELLRDAGEDGRDALVGTDLTGQMGGGAFASGAGLQNDAGVDGQ